MTDPNQQIVYCSQAGIKTFNVLLAATSRSGLKVSNESLIGQSLGSVLPEARDWLADGGKGKEEEKTIADQVVKLVVSPITSNSGKLLGVISEWTNVTETLNAQRLRQEQIDREMENAQTLNSKADELLDIVDSAVKGDLTRDVTVKGDDVIGRMGVAVESLLNELRDNLLHIRGNAAELTLSSEALTATSQEIDQLASDVSGETRSVKDSTDEVNGSVDMAAAAVAEMSASIKEISNNTSEATSVAKQAVKIAQSTNNTVRQLSDSSHDIGNVLKVITSIAEQTNLLALNATIEAARAGDAGKGFAVVANEVKELAKETARATEEIGGRINTIQSASAETVTAITTINETIAKVNDIQSTIAVAIDQQDVATNEISSTMQSTANNSDRIATAINTVSKGVDDTQNGVNRLHATAGDIAAMAISLNERVSRFRLVKDHAVDIGSGKAGLSA